jgi:hypothetical protein
MRISRFKPESFWVYDQGIEGAVSLMIDKFEFISKHAIIKRWGAYSNPVMIEYRFWEWYAWIETIDGEFFTQLYRMARHRRDIDLIDFIHNNDYFTRMLRTKMNSKFGFRNFMES